MRRIDWEPAVDGERCTSCSEPAVMKVVFTTLLVEFGFCAAHWDEYTELAAQVVYEGHL